MNRTTFAILTLLFNSYGVPCFIQGNAGLGVKRIILACVTCGIVGIINGIKGIILGIQLFKMTDEEFDAQFGTIDSGIPANKPAEGENA